MPKLTPEKRRKLQRRAQQQARLLSSTVPPGLAEALDIKSDVSEDAISLIVDEVARFNEANAAIRGSHRYYYAALAKVYDVWLRISPWPAEKRKQFFYQLNGGSSKITRRGGDLHILLRAMIHHSGDARAEQRLRTRDAGALREVSRLQLSPEELKRRFDQGVAGLDQLYRDDVKNRRANKAVIERDRLQSAMSKPQDAFDPGPTSSPDAGAERNAPVRLTWGKGLNKDDLVTSAKRPHDAWILARIDPYDQKIVLKRAYLTEHSQLDQNQLRDAVKVLKEAGLSKRRVGRPRRS